MSSRSTSLCIGLAALAASAPAVASAHLSIGSTAGFVHGLAHPLSGIDHVLTMVAVGAFAAKLGGRALWAVPLTFMALMVVGGALGVAGLALPFVELGIALSIMVLGLAIAIRLKWPVAAAVAMVGVFAIFHGHAHGTEMPVDSASVNYALGFVMATGLLHLAGIGIGLWIGETRRITQAAGAAVALVGVAFAGGLV